MGEAAGNGSACAFGTMAPHPPVGQRPPGLDGHAPQINLSLSLDGRAHVVFLAHRDTAGADDQVGAFGRLTQGLTGGFPRVGDDAQIQHFAAQPAQQRVEHEAVGVVDAPGRQGLAGHDQFVTGEEAGHARTTMYLQRGRADGGGQTNGSRSEASAFGQHGAAGGDVLGAAAHPGARCGLHPEAHTGALATCQGQASFHFLLHHHGVSAGRQGRTGEDARHGAGLKRLALMAGRNALRDRKHLVRIGGQVGGAHGVAIHLGIVPGRDIQRGHQRPGQHAPVGIHGVDGLGARQRVGVRQQAGEGVVEGKQCRHGARGRQECWKAGHQARRPMYRPGPG